MNRQIDARVLLWATLGVFLIGSTTLGNYTSDYFQWAIGFVYGAILYLSKVNSVALWRVLLGVIFLGVTNIFIYIPGLFLIRGLDHVIGTSVVNTPLVDSLYGYLFFFIIGCTGAVITYCVLVYLWATRFKVGSFAIVILAIAVGTLVSHLIIENLRGVRFYPVALNSLFWCLSFSLAICFSDRRLTSHSPHNNTLEQTGER